MRFVYRAIFFSIRVTIIILWILFFVPIAMGTFHRPTMLKEKRQVSVIMRLLRQELRKATAGLKQTSPARSPSRPRTMRYIAPCNILAYIYIYVYVYIVYMYDIIVGPSCASRTLSCTHARGVIFPESARQRETTTREKRLKIFATTFARGSAQLSPFVYLAFPQIQDRSLRNCLRFSIYISLLLSHSSILSIISLPRSVMSLTLMQPTVSPEFCSLSDNVHVRQ